MVQQEKKSSLLFAENAATPAQPNTEQSCSPPYLPRLIMKTLLAFSGPTPPWSLNETHADWETLVDMLGGRGRGRWTTQ